MAHVTMTIDLNGNVTLEVNGVSGPACQDLTANVERLLGTVTRVEQKDQYHESSGESAQLGQF